MFIEFRLLGQSKNGIEEILFLDPACIESIKAVCVHDPFCTLTMRSGNVHCLAHSIDVILDRLCMEAVLLELNGCTRKKS